MDKSKRVRLIQQIRSAMDSMQWDDMDMVLETFGLGAMPEGPDDFTLTQWLQNGSDADLLALGQHFELSAAADAHETAEASATRATNPGVLLIFASHLSTQRAFVGDVAVGLQAYGVKLFVAHDSIPIDAQWEPEIASALQTCHAGAAFLHKGIHDSYYCMQEIGWLLGRTVPIARLICEEAPKGLLGSKQGINARSMGAEAVAEALVDYSLTKPGLHPMLATSFVYAMRNSRSFKQTDLVWARLHEMKGLSATQCELLVEAAEQEGQVFRAGVGGPNGRAYRRAIADFLDTQTGSKGLAKRIRALRDQADSGVPI